MSDHPKQRHSVIRDTVDVFALPSRGKKQETSVSDYVKKQETAQSLSQTDRDRLADFCGLICCDIDNRRRRWYEQPAARGWIFCYYDEWKPDVDRNHLAVVLREVYQRGLENKLRDAVYAQWDELGDGFFDVWAIGLFAHSPATIVRATMEVLETQK